MNVLVVEAVARTGHTDPFGMTNKKARTDDYSYLRVATGSNRAARLAGRVPKITPTMTDVARAMTALQ